MTVLFSESKYQRIQHRRGTEAPMDFEMDGSLTVDENKVWLRAATEFTNTIPEEVHPSIQSDKQNVIVDDKMLDEPMISEEPSSLPTTRSFKTTDTPIHPSSSDSDDEDHIKDSLESLTFNTLLPRKRKKTVTEQLIESPDTPHHFSHGHSWWYPYHQPLPNPNSSSVASIPHLVREYVHLFFTITTVGLTLFIIIHFVWTVHHDLEMKAAEYSMETTKQIQECSRHYLDNRCDPTTRTPALETLCNDWEICMLRDPAVVGRLQVGAETLAEILNKLVEPLSYKAMILGIILVFGSVWLSASSSKRSSSSNTGTPPTTTRHEYIFSSSPPVPRMLPTPYHPIHSQMYSVPSTDFDFLPPSSSRFLSKKKSRV